MDQSRSSTEGPHPGRLWQEEQVKLPQNLLDRFDWCRFRTGGTGYHENRWCCVSVNIVSWHSLRSSIVVLVLM